MQLEQERRHNAKVAAATAQCPVEVCVVIRADPAKFAVGCDDVHFEHVVDRHTEAPAKPTKAAAQCQATNAGVRNRARGRNQAVRHCLMIEFAQQAATSYAGGLGGAVDPRVAQSRKVDLHTLVAARLAGGAVSAALHSQEQVIFSCKRYGVLHVRGPRWLDYQGGIFVVPGIQ